MTAATRTFTLIDTRRVICPGIDPEILMSEMTSHTLRRNWLPALTPVWDSAAAPLVVFSGRPLICGSGPECDLQISLAGVEKCHCELEFSRGVLTVVHAYSSVWINDIPARAGSKIEAGDQVAVGSATFRVEEAVEDDESIGSHLEFHAASALRPGERDLHTERLQAWHYSLQKRSDELSRQADQLEGRFSQLLQSQTDCEQRAHSLEEARGTLHAERLAAEDLRLQLEEERERVEQAAHDLENRQQEHEERGTSLQQEADELRACSEVLAADREKLAAETGNLKEEWDRLEGQRSHFEAERAEHQTTVARDRAAMEEEASALRDTQSKVQSDVAAAQESLAELRREHQKEEAEWAHRRTEFEQQELGLRTQLEQHEQSLMELSQRQADVGSLENALEQRRQNADDEESRLQTRIAECDEREASIRSAFEQQELAARVLQEEQDALTERAAAVESREDEIGRRENEISQREDEITERDEHSHVLEQDIERQRVELAARVEEAEQKAEQFREQEAALLQRSQELDVQSLRIDEEKLEIESEREGLREQLSEVSAADDRHAEIEKQQQELAEKAASIETGLADLENQKLVFQAEQESRADAVAKSQQELDDRNDDVCRREQDLEERRESLAAEQKAWNDRIAEESEQSGRCELEREQVDADRQMLREWEAELQARHDETAARIQDFKRLKSSLASEAPVTNDDRDQISAVEAERDALAAAMNELQQHVDALQEELESQHDNGNPDHATQLVELTEAIAERDQTICQHAEMHETLLSQIESLQGELSGLRDEADSREDGRVAELTSELADRAQEVERVRTELRDLEAQLEATDQEMAALQLESDAEQSGLKSRLADLEVQLNHPSEQEENLLREVEELRSEVQAAKSSDGDAEALLTRSAEQEATIQQLTEQLQAAEQKLSEHLEGQTVTAEREAESRRQLEERDDVISDLREQVQALRDDASIETAESSSWEQQLAERDGMIRELQEQLVSAAAATESSSVEYTDDEILMRSRELDDRTVVLDRRDDELGEWNRRLQNTEEELEAERRQLQDARQQLELARAELQVSIEHDTPVAEPYEDVALPTDAEPDVDQAQEESASHLRSELASLFGMGAGSEPEVMESAPPDVSTEGGDSVVMSFEDTHGVLLGAPAEESVADQTDGEDSDYVTRYMEQLLARNRSSAGESLPEELNKATEADTEADATAASEPVSFIEKYGQNFEEEDQPVDERVATPVERSAATTQPSRQKIDLDALRHDMDSFRQVSVRSVQKALESHAMKKERSGLAGRQAVTVVLVLMTIFVAATHVMGIIDFPLLVWGLVIGSAAAAAELVRQTYAVKSRVRELTEPVSAPSVSPNPLSAEDGEATSEEMAGSEDEGDTEELDVPVQVPPVVSESGPAEPESLTETNPMAAAADETTVTVDGAEQAHVDSAGQAPDLGQFSSDDSVITSMDDEEDKYYEL